MVGRSSPSLDRKENSPYSLSDRAGHRPGSCQGIGVGGGRLSDKAVCIFGVAGTGAGNSPDYPNSRRISRTSSEHRSIISLVKPKWRFPEAEAPKNIARLLNR